MRLNFIFNLFALLLHGTLYAQTDNGLTKPELVWNLTDQCRDLKWEPKARCDQAADKRNGDANSTTLACFKNDIEIQKRSFLRNPQLGGKLLCNHDYHKLLRAEAVINQQVNICIGNKSPEQRRNVLLEEIAETARFRGYEFSPEPTEVSIPGQPKFTLKISNLFLEETIRDESESRYPIFASVQAICPDGKTVQLWVTDGVRHPVNPNEGRKVCDKNLRFCQFDGYKVSTNKKTLEIEVTQSKFGSSCSEKVIRTYSLDHVCENADAATRPQQRRSR